MSFNPSWGDKESTDTTHFNIIDSYGNIASVTSTIGMQSLELL
jgi:gamma-glutamyltranspeptidase